MIKMNKLIMILACALSSASSFANVDKLLTCSHDTDPFNYNFGTAVGVTVEMDSVGLLYLHITQCRKQPFAGCSFVNMDVAFPVAASDGVNYVGHEGSLIKSESESQTTYIATVNQGTQIVFDESDCSTSR